MKSVLFLFCLFLFSHSIAQGNDSPHQLDTTHMVDEKDDIVRNLNPRQIARDGNANYKDNSYSDAEIQYRKSLYKNNSFDAAKFNLSNSLFKQARYAESLDLLNDIIKTTNDSLLESEAHYNMGNNYIMMADNNSQDPNMIDESLKNAINSYKNCLKINPLDEEARHNLSKALRRLQKQKQNQNNNDQERDQDKKEQQNSGQTDGEDEQNEKNKEKDKENNDPKDGGKSNSDQKEEGDSDGDLLGNELSKEDMQRMLEALDREEKDVQEKMRKINFSKQKNKQIEKDW